MFIDNNTSNYRRIESLFNMQSATIKKPQQAGTFVLVAPPRENWNDIFSGITRLSDELEKLGIDIVMETDNA